MKKRKQNKIIEDADLILEVAKDCCTYSEIVEKTGISINKVRLSVKKAGIMKKIKKILLENKKIKIKKVKTLYDFKDGYITLSSNPYKYVEVVSAESKICYSKGKYRLSVGDEIFIAQKNKDSILILQFKVINLNDSNNVVELSKKYYHEDKVESEYAVFYQFAKKYFKTATRKI